MKLLSIFVLALTVAPIGSLAIGYPMVEPATCKPKGKGICNACSNCKYCKNCSVNGGECTVCAKKK